VSSKFRVGISADFKTAAEGLLEPVLAERLDPQPELEYEFMAEFKEEVTPDQIRDYDAVITLQPRYTADSLRGVERLAVMARWGVGYDMIDVKACTDADVLLAITRDAVRRPVAEGMMTLLLGITHYLLVKDGLVRNGRWAERVRYLGVGIGGRVLGLVGIGNIGSEFLRLIRPFGLGRVLASDPYVSPAQAAEVGIELVGLETLLAESDFVCISCPLTRETFHLIAEPQLGLMKPTAFLINAARGPIVDQVALTRALQERRIAGAGLDVFEQEPLPADDPLNELDNVILSPHAIGWTDALVRDNGVGACENVLAVSKGEIPEHAVNREVVERPGFRAKLRALRNR
jgi:phosphoglycerate dehydrogenase-like enzyme